MRRRFKWLWVFDLRFILMTFAVLGLFSLPAVMRVEAERGQSLQEVKDLDLAVEFRIKPDVPLRLTFEKVGEDEYLWLETEPR